MDLEYLAGKHVLSGIDRFTDTRKTYEYSALEQCEVLRIVLDGRTYEVWEDPSDGYRSNHCGPKRTRARIKNAFLGVDVFCIHKTNGSHGSSDDILAIYAIETGKEILSFGTSDIDDYYPSWVCNFDAEALDKASPSKGDL